MAPFYRARQKYFDYLYRRDINTWYVLDPVITVHPDEPPRILGCIFDPLLCEALKLIHLSFCSGYVGALACESQVRTVRHGTFALSA